MGQLDGGPAGRRTSRGSPAGSLARRAPRGVAQVLGHCAHSGFDDLCRRRLSSGCCPSHRGRAPWVGAGRLDPAARRRLASEPRRRPAACAAPERRARRSSGRADVQRGSWVERHHELELLVAQRVEIRGRAHAAVDVRAAVDLDAAVEPWDRARRGDRVGESGRWRAGPTERHPPSGRVVDRHRPKVGMRRPIRSARSADGVLQRLGGDDPARQPAREHRRGE